MIVKFADWYRRMADHCCNNNIIKLLIYQTFCGKYGIDRQHFVCIKIKLSYFHSNFKISLLKDKYKRVSHRNSFIFGPGLDGTNMWFLAGSLLQ